MRSSDCGRKGPSDASTTSGKHTRAVVVHRDIDQYDPPGTKYWFWGSGNLNAVHVARHNQ